MRRRRRTRQASCLLSLAAIACVGISDVSACDSGGTECACPAAGLTVNVPEALASGVLSITPTGMACMGAAVSPTPGAKVAATQFHIEPRQTGPCHLDILFTDGTAFDDEVTVIETTGCCAGLRTDPPGAADIDVPPPLDGATGEVEPYD